MNNVRITILDGYRNPMTDGSLFGGEPQRVDVEDGNIAYALAVAADRLPRYAALQGEDNYPVTIQVMVKSECGGWDFVDAYDMAFQGDIEDMVTKAGGQNLATSALGTNGLHNLRQAWKLGMNGKSFSRS